MKKKVSNHVIFSQAFISFLMFWQSVLFLPTIHAQNTTQWQQEISLQPQVRSYAFSKSFQDTLEFFNSNWRSLKLNPQEMYYWHQSPAWINWEGQLKKIQNEDTLSFYFQLGLKKDAEAWVHHSQNYQSNTFVQAKDLNLNFPDSVWIQYHTHHSLITLGKKSASSLDTTFTSVSLNSIHPLEGMEIKYYFTPKTSWQMGVWSLNPWLSQGSYNNEDSLQSLSTATNQRGRIFNQKSKTLVKHGIEYVGDIFKIGFNEFNIIGGKEPDFYSISPFNIWHNNFNEGSENSFLSLYAKTQIHSFAIFTEYTLDEINSPVGEKSGDGQLLGAFTLGLEFFKKINPLSQFKITSQYFRIDPHFGVSPLPLLNLTQREVYHSNYRSRDAAHFADIWIVDWPLGYWRGNNVEDLWINVDWCSKSWNISFKNAYFNALEAHDSEALPQSLTQELEINFNMDSDFIFSQSTISSGVYLLNQYLLNQNQNRFNPGAQFYYRIKI